MALQVNVNDILTQLYQHRGIVEFLFANRENISVNELLNRGDINQEQLNKLKSLDLVYEYEGIVSLNDALVAMFEDFMEIGEVTPGFINDYINELQRYIRFYQDAREMRFLRSIKKYLRRINSTLTREIIKLQKNVDDTYKNESNYRIKLQKLEAYREKRDTIIDFIKKTSDVVEQTRTLFALTNDSELYGIVQTLKGSLIENLDYLIEIQTDITDFINKIQFQLDVYVKAQRLKEIKDHGTLHFKTNFAEVVGSINTLRHNGYKSPKTKIAVESLYTDEGHVLCKKIAEKYKLTRLLIRGVADRMAGNFKEKGLEQQIKLDTAKLVDRFIGQNKLNLFEYLVDYKFPKAIGNVSLEERLSLFVEIAMEYQTNLDFKYVLQYYDYQDNEKRNKRLGYTVILPPGNKKKEKKKTVEPTETA
jgi:translation initiation factor 2 beta subunit (eIF-2beta)/eIF-5